MNGIIIYYSLLGHNEQIAQRLERDKGYDVIEFAPGSLMRVFQFFFRKKRLNKKAQELKERLKEIDDIIICSPIWAGKPAPAVIALLNNLDLNGKRIECHFTYTQNHGNTEDIVNDIVDKNSGEMSEIEFHQI